jgi:peptidoglycan/LPS O-acetylase OafA/YrhL
MGLSFQEMIEEGQMSKQDRLEAVDLVRAFAIIGVLMVHATSSAFVSNAESSIFYAYSFLNKFFKFGTPTFIFLSSFILFYNYCHRPFRKETLGKFYKNRGKYILVPYLVFSLFYFFVIREHPGLSPQELAHKFFSSLAVGKTYTHLYFLFINVQFYLLFPLFLAFFRKYRRMPVYAVFAGFAVQAAFLTVHYFVLPEPLPYKASWAFYHFPSYFLGAFFGIYYDRLKAWISVRRELWKTPVKASWIGLWAFAAAFGLLHVQAFYNNMKLGVDYHLVVYDVLWTLHTSAAAVVLLQLAHVLHDKGSPRIVAVLRHLGAHSFGIYLIHPTFLHLYRSYPVPRDSLLYHPWVAGGFVLALLLSWVIVTLAVRYMPGAWVLFGKPPEQYGRKQSVARRPAGTTVAK